MSAKTFTITTSPHLKTRDSVSAGMWDVVIAMIPAIGVALYAYRFDAIAVFVVSILACLISQIVIGIFRGHGFAADGSVIVTGLILGMCFAPGSSPVLLAIAGFMAIGIAKELVGGLGYNRFNPAAFGKSAAVICGWFLGGVLAAISLGWANPIDAVTGATPLAALKYAFVVGGAGQAHRVILPSAANLFLLNPGGGALAEVSVLAVLVGAVYLLIKRRITLTIPLAIIIPVFLITLAVTKSPQGALLYTLAGGLFFGAFFMATDWVTAPMTAMGQIIFGVLIGVCVCVFRLFLPPTGGVVFSILIGNVFVPLIDKITKKKAFGAA